MTVISSRPGGAGPLWNNTLDVAVTLRTVTVADAVPERPPVSLTVAVVTNVPGVAYVCGATSPLPAWPSPKFHCTVYGGTPPDGWVLNPNVITVAAATPEPVGATDTVPALTPGMIEVVVVVVVCVTLTVPIGSAGDPPQRIETTASSKAIGSSLRTDIRLVRGSLKRQIDAGDRRHTRVQSGVAQRDQRIQRHEQFAFEIRLQARSEIDAASAFVQRDDPLRSGEAGRIRHGPESDPAPAEHSAAQHIDQHRQLRRGLELDPTGELKLVTRFDRRVPRVRHDPNALAPVAEADVAV